MNLLKICANCCKKRTGTIIVGLLDFTVHIFLIRYTFTNPDDPLIPIFKTNELQICFYSTSMITIIFLLAGALKGNKWLMIPWIGVKMTGIISIVVHGIYLLIYFSKDYIFFSLVKIWAGSFAFALAILIIFVMIVARYFNEITRGKTQVEAEPESQGLSLTIVKPETETEEQEISSLKIKAQNEIEDHEIPLTENADGAERKVPVNHTFF